jgi:predicted RNA-binding protein YlqC (UPF0109 family)
VKALVESIVFSLVDDVSQARVQPTSRDGQDILTVIVAEGDVGRVIGKDGRIVNALRTIVKAGASKSQSRVLIEVLSVSEYIGQSSAHIG